jgi:hypothetical protein
LTYKLWQKGSSIQGIRPVVLYYKIVSSFKDEFNLFANWTCKIISYNYNYPEEFPKEKFPQIYNIINDFKTEYRNPFVDIFYFILIISERCPICHKICDAYSQIASSLSLDNKIPNSNITNLIGNYMGKNNINNYTNCACGYFGNAIEEKMFYTTPDYLVLDLDEGKKVYFDYEIDLSEYIITNKCPSKYGLYAVINRKIINNSNLLFFCSINENGRWTYYSLNNIKKCGTEFLKEGIPSLAIYKKIINPII